MIKLKTNADRSVSFLRFSDEMQFPYERALQPFCKEVNWHASYEMLLATASKEDPFIVIVDLDCLTSPLEAPLESLRAAFPKSDFIALSSSDTAQVALQCFRAGCSDFLLKPVSPEELSYTIRKCVQRRDLMQRLEDPRTELMRAVARVSSCTSPNLARLSTLEYLQGFLGSKGAAWLLLDARGPQHTKVACALPKNIAPAAAIARLPDPDLWFERPSSLVVRAGQQRKVFLPCQYQNQGAVFLWGIEKPVARRRIAHASVLVEHAEMSLLNIQKYDEIKKLTFVDDLTGLFNSRYLKFALANAVRKTRPNHGFAVLFLDVDHFKRVNDQHGHVIGSDFLVAIGKTIRNSVRNIDPVFRYGGDEFVVILHDSDEAGAIEIAERIRKHIERRVFVIKGQHIQTTVSIGIALYPLHAGEIEQLLQMADEAMYTVKRQTRNATYIADPTKQLKIPEAI